VSDNREIWVLPEIYDREKEVSKLSLGLLSRASRIKQKVGGVATALLFSHQQRDFRPILVRYGIERALVFKHSLFERYLLEPYLKTLLKWLEQENPWMLLMGDTTTGRELAPQLALLAGTGCIPGCVKIDLTDPQKPVFYRPILGGQMYLQESFVDAKTMIITLSEKCLDDFIPETATEPVIQEINIDFNPDVLRVEHLDYCKVDFRAIDLTESEVIVSAGAGAASDDILPLVSELAELLQGSLGASRPVVDEGKMPRNRLIGQTGKVVSPDLYLALGISGASHHIGGIQDSRFIVSINKDPYAPILQSSDQSFIADLREILPALIEKIKKAKKDGTIL